jgi:threonine/homoserine/homoserine lactone efflux protein
MTSAELASLLLFTTAMAFTPGPNTTLSAALGANGGMRAAMPFVLAVPVGWGMLLVASVVGLGAALDAAPAARSAVKAAGLAYMLWLAWRLAQNRRLGEANAALNVGFGQGVALQFVNIKAWMTALLVSGGWVTVSPDWQPRLLLVLPIMMAYALLSNLTYAAIGSLLRAWLSVGVRLLVFNRAVAMVLVVTALWMALL